VLGISRIRWLAQVGYSSMLLFILQVTVLLLRMLNWILPASGWNCVVLGVPKI